MKMFRKNIHTLIILLTVHISYIDSTTTTPINRNTHAGLMRQDTFVVTNPKNNYEDLVRLSYADAAGGKSVTVKPQTTNKPQPTTRSGSPNRDWVNPSVPKNKNVITSTPVPNRNTATTKSSQSRDWVNPSLPKVSVRTTTTTRSPTTSSKPTDPRRDWVNPNLPKQPWSSPKPQVSPVKPPSYANVASQGDRSKLPTVTTASPKKDVTTSKTTTVKGSTEQPEIASDEELKSFSEQILKRDVNNAAKFVTVNYQQKTKYGVLTTDPAPQPLLTVNPEAFKIPTIEKLQLLFNNYIQDAAVNEYVTPQERTEENNLLDAVISTSIMTYTRKFLIDKQIISQDPKDFKDTLKRIWFNMYSRGGGKIGSSAFEHVFVSEIKKGEVSGLHNWVYFSQEETKNNADYLGFMRKLDLGDKGAILKLRFKLNGIDKPTNSLFIGTSPELEMSLYTVCFLTRPNRSCPQRLNGHDFTIKTYSYKYRGKNMIGSAFPEI